MQLVAVAVDHSTASVPVREQFALAGPALEDALARLRDTGAEGFILSTCNRTEYYAYAGHGDSGRRLLTSLLRDSAADGAQIPDGAIVGATGEDAVRRLFEIASGMRSMVTGESDIMRQLKVALVAARRTGAARDQVHRLGMAALAVGKRVRDRTCIGRRRASVVSVALDSAESRLTSIAPRVAVIGAGATAGQVLAYLLRRQRSAASRVTVVARRPESALSLAQPIGGRVVGWEGLGEAVAESDLVVCCTSAPGHVIGPRAVLAAQRVRHHLPLVLVDLATPRDVDPMVRNIGGVTVIDLDDVEQVARASDDQHAAAIEEAQQVVTHHVHRYIAWWRSRQVAPTITQFVARGAAIRDSEVERLLAQLPALDANERRAVTLMAARLTNKLLHAPLAALNRHPEEATMVTALRMLFDLDSAPRTTCADATSVAAPASQSR